MLIKARFSFIVIAAVFFCNVVSAQILRPVKWTYSAKKVNKNEILVTLTAHIDKGWHIYAEDLGSGDGPVPTSFTFEKNDAYSLDGKTTEQKPIVEMDQSFNKKIGFFITTAVFKQRIKLKSPKAIKDIKGSLEYMVCNNSKCLPPETVEFSAQVTN